MKCQEVIEYMHRQLDGDLNEQEQEILLKHTRHCPDCATMFERLKMLSSELESLPRVTPSYSLVDAILPKLEQLEQQSISNEPQVEQQEQLPRRMKKERKWPAVKAWSGIIAASIVAGLFIVSYNSGLFDKSANDSAAEFSTASADNAKPDGAAAYNMPTSDIKRFADSNKAGEVNVESLSEDGTDITKQDEPAEQGVSSGAGSRKADEGMVAGGTPTYKVGVAGQSDNGQLENDVPAPIELSSSDGIYTAKVSGYVISVSKTGESESIFESPRKNGKIANLSWSEDNKQLTYEIQSGQGSAEIYVIDIETRTEEKAAH